MSEHIKVKPSKIKIDPRFQRDLDEPRARNMSKGIDMDRIGVPVVSKRGNGSFVALDGQHRVTALCMAGLGEQAILCEVHEGLSIQEEAALFLKLNGGRKAVRIYDKFKAELVAKDRTALDIQTIVRAAGLRISKAPANNSVCAIGSLRSVHLRLGNLPDTLSVLAAWSDGDHTAYDGELIKDMAEFLAAYPDIDVTLLIKRLSGQAPDRILSRIKRMKGSTNDIPRQYAACSVLREVYNKHNRKPLPVPQIGGFGRVLKKREITLKAAE